MKKETNDELHNNRISEYVTQTSEEQLLIPKYKCKQQSTVVHCNSSSEHYGQLQNNLILEDNIISNSSVNKNSDNVQSKSLNLVLPSPFGNNNPLNDRFHTKSNHNKTNMKCDVIEELVCDDTINVDNETKVSIISGKGIDTNIILIPTTNTPTKNKKMYKKFSNSLLIKNNNFNTSILKCNEIVRDTELVYLTDHCYTNIKMDSINFENNSNNYDSDRDVETDTGVIDSEKYKIYLSTDKFSSSRQIVYFLFKSLPLVTKLANDPSYRCHNPYTASSLNEFSSWHRTKRFCSEVSVHSRLTKRKSVYEIITN